MTFVNSQSREINCKIVYYGPSFSGKTTNLTYIYNHTDGKLKGKLISLGTGNDRTLFFDFISPNFPLVREFTVRIHLYTVPGQVNSEDSNKLALKGVDGIVFVADSQSNRMDANQESVKNLRIYLAEQGINLDTIPYAIQYNKRDVADITDVASLRQLINPTLVPDFESVASTGVGVFNTLGAVIKKVISNLKNPSQA